MLNGNIHIFDKSWVIAQLCNKFVGYFVGVAIKQSYPRYIGSLANFAYKPCKAIFSVNIKTVALGVLRYKIKLLHTERLKIARLSYYILDFTASEYSAD